MQVIVGKVLQGSKLPRYFLLSSPSIVLADSKGVTTAESLSNPQQSVISGPFRYKVGRRLRRCFWTNLRDARNPFVTSPKLPARNARIHFADHCAVCHANNGSGDTEIGRNLYPKAPDMRLSGTQDMTDGEIYYAIQWNTAIGNARCLGK